MGPHAVWRFVPVGDVVNPLMTLSRAERGRAARLRHPHDREAYLAAHVVVRECAGALLGVSSSSLMVKSSCAHCGSDEHGVPSLVGFSDVAISLSHTQGHVAAVAHRRDCGIDVDRIDRPGPPRSALTVREQGWVDAQEDSQRAAMRIWVRKEALIKSGVGNLDDLQAVDVVDQHGLRCTVEARAIEEWSHGSAVGAVAHRL